MNSPGRQVTNNATGGQWRDNPRKSEGMEPKQKHPVVDVTGMEARSDAVKNNIAQEPGMLSP